MIGAAILIALIVAAALVAWAMIRGGAASPEALLASSNWPPSTLR